MSAIVRNLPHAVILEKPNTVFASQKWGVSTIFLMVIVLLSGLAVIYLADLNRRSAIELEDTITTQNQLHLDWEKLLLEQSTWSTQARIQNIAAQQLSMQVPSPKQIVIVKINP